MYHLYVIAQVSPPSELHEGIELPQKEIDELQDALQKDPDTPEGETVAPPDPKNPSAPKA